MFGITVFMVTPKALRASEDDRVEINSILHWKPRPDVRHVIFISVPHRGSEMASSFVGGSDELSPDCHADLQASMRACTGTNPDAVRPAFAAHFPVANSPVSTRLPRAIRSCAS